MTFPVLGCRLPWKQPVAGGRRGLRSEGRKHEAQRGGEGQIISRRTEEDRKEREESPSGR